MFATGCREEIYQKEEILEAVLQGKADKQPLVRVGMEGERSFMVEAHIEKLYELSERAKREKDQEAEAALRWAIFLLENLCRR